MKDYVVDRALKGWNGAQILRALEQDERLASRAPGIRTVQTIVREVTTRDMSAPWIALDADDPREAALVLPVLGEVMARSGRSVSLSREQARLIAWIRTVATDIPLNDAYELARLVAVRDPREQNERLVPYLALAPWLDRGVRYIQAFRRLGFRRLMVGDWVVDFAASQEIRYDVIDSEEEPKP